MKWPQGWYSIHLLESGGISPFQPYVLVASQVVRSHFWSSTDVFVIYTIITCLLPRTLFKYYDNGGTAVKWKQHAFMDIVLSDDTLVRFVSWQHLKPELDDASDAYCIFTVCITVIYTRKQILTRSLQAALFQASLTTLVSVDVLCQYHARVSCTSKSFYPFPLFLCGVHGSGL